MEYDGYLKKKLSDFIVGFGAEHIDEYMYLYESCEQSDLKKIYSLLHYKVNYLLKELNERNERIETRHYLAQDSRDLLSLIGEIHKLQTNLKDSKFKFHLNPNYEKKLHECKGFLKITGGSTIPEGFIGIQIIENKPIFIVSNSIEMQSKVYFNKDQVAEGSYARVYKFKDPNYNHLFAVKEALDTLNESDLIRFKQEFEQMKELDSPYIIEVYKFNSDNNSYTMEYVDQTLENFIKKNDLCMKEKVSIIKQIINAFIYINSKGILHRDISVTNILIKEYEKVNIIKVSDFGLAKTSESTLTKINTEVKGSLNDPQLGIIGFKNYEIRHETYALTRLIYFIIEERITKGSFQTKELEDFYCKGISSEISERFASVEELQDNFNNIIETLR